MISVEAVVSPNHGFIGDEFVYKLTIHHGRNDQVAMVPSAGIWVPFEARGIEKHTTGQSADHMTTYVCRISIYEMGSFKVPTQTVMAQTQGQTQRYEVPAIPVAIQSVLNAASPTPNGLKPPMTASVSWGFYLGWGFVLILAFCAGLLGYRFFKKKFDRVVDVIAPMDTRSAYDIASEALQRLEAEDLAKEGDYKQHYLRLSDVLKALFSSHYGAPVSEMTTDETLAFLSRRLKMDQVRLVREVLEVGDLVKFAKSVPSDDIHYDALVKAKLILEWYKPVIKEGEA